MNNSLHIEKWVFHPPGNLRYEADVWRPGLLHLILSPFTLWLQLRMFGSDLPTGWKCTELRIQISQGESYCVDLQLVSCCTVTTCQAGPGTQALEFGPLRRCRWYQAQFCLVSCWDTWEDGLQFLLHFRCRFSLSCLSFGHIFWSIELEHWYHIYMIRSNIVYNLPWKNHWSPCPWPAWLVLSPLPS